MKKNKLLYNGIIYTMADDRKKGGLKVNSMAVTGSTIVAAGNNLEKDPDFGTYEKIDLKGKTVIPGLVDAHTHFYFVILSMGTAKLDGLTSLEKTLRVIKRHCKGLKKDEWVIGEGFSPDRWHEYIVPDRYMLDKICGDLPAAIWSKDQHMMWVNSAALKIARLNKRSPEPVGGKIERDFSGEPTGILKEIPAYFPVFKNIKQPSEKKLPKLYRQARELAYSRGVTAVHSMDGPEALPFFYNLSQKRKLGLRINYYAPGSYLPELAKKKIKYGFGNDYFRVSGLKMFGDGSLGSQTALCYNKYKGSRDNYGVEVTSVKELKRVIQGGAKLGLPCAIHAIGDKAIGNILEAFETAGSKGQVRGRNRIEHLQMIRRKDIPRLKKLGLVASMQPSHCPSDIKIIEKYWGGRGRNCYIFKTLLDNNIPLAFGSDSPIEPLDPLAGIYDAVNRKDENSQRLFYPKERLSVLEALYNFTVGPAYAVNQELERGFLLPGYKADFVILSDNITKVGKTGLKNIKILATFFDGKPVYTDKKIKF